MTLKLALLSILLAAAPAMAGNFATCLLDKMPGSVNGATHAAIYRTCANEFPEKFTSIARGSGRGLFGFKDENACIIKKAKDTTFQYSAGAISIACHCLYKKPDFDGEICAYEPLKWGG